MNNETTANDVKILMAIKSADDIKSVEVLDMYEDDHALCADVEINAAFVFFGWYDYNGLSFLEYWNESERARNELFDNVRHKTAEAIEQLDESEVTAQMDAWLSVYNKQQQELWDKNRA
jgi:hypothetical protein